MTQPNTGTTGQQQTQQAQQGQQGGAQQQSPPAQQQPPQGDPNAQGGTGQQGQQQGAGGQQQTVDPGFEARLDALLGAGQQGQASTTQQQQTGGQGDGQGQQQQGQGDEDLRTWLSTQLGTMRQSISDSVRNSVLNEMRRTGQAPPSGNNGDGQPQGQQQQQQQPAPQRPAGPDPMDLREARMGFTQYIGDTRTFTSPDERALANTVGGQLVAQELEGGATPDAAARKAATEVAGQLDGFVRSIEQRVVNRLRERGQLVASDGSQPAGTNTPASNVDTKRTWATDLAKQYNARTNPSDPGQQAG